MLLAFLPCFGILKSPGFFFSNPPAVHRFDVGAHRGVLATEFVNAHARTETLAPKRQEKVGGYYSKFPLAMYDRYMNFDYALYGLHNGATKGTFVSVTSAVMTTTEELGFEPHKHRF